MSFFRNELEYLQKENRLRRKALSDDSNQRIDKLTRRLTTARVGRFELALAEKKLIGKALLAERQNRPFARSTVDKEAFLESMLTGRNAQVGEMLLENCLSVAKLFCLYTLFPFIIHWIDYGIAPAQHPLRFWEPGALEYILWMFGVSLAITLMMVILDLFVLHPHLRYVVTAVLILGLFLLPLLFPEIMLPIVENKICVGTALLSIVFLIASRLAWNAYVHVESERFAWQN